MGQLSQNQTSPPPRDFLVTPLSTHVLTGCLAFVFGSKSHALKLCSQSQKECWQFKGSQWPCWPQRLPWLFPCGQVQRLFCLELERQPHRTPWQATGTTGILTRRRRVCKEEASEKLSPSLHPTSQQVLKSLTEHPKPQQTVQWDLGQGRTNLEGLFKSSSCNGG